MWKRIWTFRNKMLTEMVWVCMCAVTLGNSFRWNFFQCLSFNFFIYKMSRTDQVSENYSPWNKSGLPPVFVKFYWNTVTPMYYLWLLSNYNGRVIVAEALSSAKPKIFTNLATYRKTCQPWTRLSLILIFSYNSIKYNQRTKKPTLCVSCPLYLYALSLERFNLAHKSVWST